MKKIINKTKKDLKIVFFSDTHGKHGEVILPEVDMAIFAGDAGTYKNPYSNKQSVLDFIEWYSSINIKHKIWIAGNHCTSIEAGLVDAKKLSEEKGLIYLEDETITIEGIKIFGSPYTPWFHDWAFNAMRGDEIQKHWDLIEPDTDIIITHGPPANTYLDTCRRGDRVGCSNLARVIADIQPKICAFGHIHEAYGTENKEILDLEDQDKPGKITKLINCSVLNLNYEMCNDPIVVNWRDMCEMHENKIKEL